jgi:hypothetical protein
MEARRRKPHRLPEVDAAKHGSASTHPIFAWRKIGAFPDQGKTLQCNTTNAMPV